MALPNSSVWEVRPTAGNDNNGGGFIAGASGTDYSQQNSPQVAYTDLVIDASDSTKATSAATPFTSAHVGNLVQITGGSGFTTGFFQIVSVASSIATFDRSIGSTSSTGGVANLGGAMATIAAVVAVMTHSNTVWVKNTGAYTVTTPLSYSLAVNSAGGPTQFIGYGTTRGDGGKVSWTTSTNGCDIIDFGAAVGTVFANFDFSSTAGTPGHGLNAKNQVPSGMCFMNCDIHGFNEGVRGNYPVDWTFACLVLYKCKIYGNSGHGVHNDASMLVLGCYIHGNGGNGLFREISGGPGGPWVIWRSVISANTGLGIQNNSGDNLGNTISTTFIFDCDIVDNGGDGVNFGQVSGAVGGIVILNSIIDGSGGYGINSVNAYTGLQLLEAIAFRNNTSGDVLNVLKGATDITLTGDPFTNKASDDFSLNSTTGAGAACKTVGQPTPFPP